MPIPPVFFGTIAHYIYKENFQPLVSFVHVHVVEVKNEESKEKENIYLVLKEQHTVLLKTAMDMYFLHVQVYFWN